MQPFERQAWEIVEPETPLIWSWHYKYLCEWLELISSGQFKKDYPEKLGLIINVPPRSGKPASSRGSHSTTTIVASVCETGLHVSPAEKNEGKPRHRVRKASFSGAV